MVKKYKRSDKLQLSKNFRLDEFKCKCGKCDPILVDDSLITWLQKIRDHFGRSVNVNSGRYHTLRRWPVPMGVYESPF